MDENVTKLLEYINKLNNDIYIYILLLGSSTAILETLLSCSDVELLDSHERKMIQWYKEAITNLIYLKKPIPPMP